MPKRALDESELYCDEVPDDESSPGAVQLTCYGCRMMSGNQMCHRGRGGCIPDSESEDEDEPAPAAISTPQDQLPRRIGSASAAGRLSQANKRRAQATAVANFRPRQVRPIQVPVMAEAQPQSDAGSESDEEQEPPPPLFRRGSGRATGRGCAGGGRGRGRGRARGATAPAAAPTTTTQDDAVDVLRARRLGGGGGKTPKQIDEADPFVRQVLNGGDVCTENQDANWMANDTACLRMHCDTQNKVINRLATLKEAHGSNHTWTTAAPKSTSGSIVTARQYERGFKGILACNSVDFKDLDQLYAFYKTFPEGTWGKRIGFTDYIAKHYYPNLGDVLLNQHGQRHKHFSNWVSGMGWLGRFIGAE